MRKLWALESLPDLEPLDVLRGGDGAARAVRLCERIDIPGAGGFVKETRLPLFSESEMEKLLGERGMEFTEENCAGVILPGELDGPAGKVSLDEGWYHYELPVYLLEKVPDEWTPAGYLPLESGRYAVVASDRPKGLPAAVAVLLVLLALAVVSATGTEELLLRLRSLL